MIPVTIGDEIFQKRDFLYFIFLYELWDVDLLNFSPEYPPG